MALLLRYTQFENALPKAKKYLTYFSMLVLNMVYTKQ